MAHSGALSQTCLMQNHRALILRSNRFLGTTLVEKGLVSSSDLEAANEKFMEIIQASELKRASILSILQFELKVLDETVLLEHLVDEYDLGLIDLNYVELRSLRGYNVDENVCWATSTIPFDKVEDTYMVATCYYLSAPVVKYWEEQLDGPIVWLGTSSSSMSYGLEKIETIHQAERDSEEE